MQTSIERVRNISEFKHWISYHFSSTRFYAILGFIFLGIISRLLPHPPNFTAINALALFSVSLLGGLRISLFTVYLFMLLSNVILGFHSNMFFVYSSFGLIVLMGNWLNLKQSLKRTICFLITSSLLFFVITNFGVWLSIPFYPKTVAGLGLCYLAAIPFLVNEMMGTLLYGVILFGWLVLAEHYHQGRVGRKAGVPFS